MSSLSIITATYNAESTLRQNLESLRNQITAYEHILVDGCSTDSTLDIVSQNSSQISKIISEPDSGFYDAINKGIRLSLGSIIGILNADDFYASDCTLEKVLKVFEDESVDACYGDLTYVREKEDGKGDGFISSLSSSTVPPVFNIVRYWESGSFRPRKFYWGWMPPHPTFFVRRSVYEKYDLFNLEMGTAADYELMLRFLLKHRVSCKYIPEVLVCMRTGGMSNASLGNRLRANRNDRKAWYVNGLKPYPWSIPMKPFRKVPQWFRRPKDDLID